MHCGYTIYICRVVPRAALWITHYAVQQVTIWIMYIHAYRSSIGCGTKDKGNIFFFYYFFCPSVRLFPAKAAHSTTDKPRPQRLVRPQDLSASVIRPARTHTHTHTHSQRESPTGGVLIFMPRMQHVPNQINNNKFVSFFFFPFFSHRPFYFFSSSSSFLIIYLFVCFVFHSVYTPSSSKDMVDIYVCVFVQELERERETPQSV